MKTDKYVIGLDFGSDSVRALLVNAATGKEIGSEVAWYRQWGEGHYCDPSKNQYRQHPQDHIDAMTTTVKNVVLKSEIHADSIVGICIDTTGSSPIAVDKNGTPLCFSPDFADNPNAMVILWKDHTSVEEANEINELARNWGGTDFTKYEGGIYSSEWFWAKILHIYRDDEDLRSAAYSWMEHCDLMTYMLVGSPGLLHFKRSRCAAGHKAMWHEEWDGLPEDEFLDQLDPSFSKLKANLYSKTFTSDQSAGNLSGKWADRLGLHQGVVVAVGTFDAHAGAVGAEVTESTLVRVMGTSTCDIVVSPSTVMGNSLIKGICGQVDGSVIPGMIGLEAGQSAFGDVLAWLVEVLVWPFKNLDTMKIKISPKEIDAVREEIMIKLSAEAAKLPLSNTAPIALDWINGRRTPDANQSLKSAIMNLSLGSSTPEIFRAMVESICFGSRKIIDRFLEEGVKIDTVIGIGGVAKKSEFVMQTLADVIQMPIKIANSEQAPALGAAMYAATASGQYKDLNGAIRSMGNGFEKTYFPNPNNADHYNTQYNRYQQLGEFVEQNSTKNG